MDAGGDAMKIFVAGATGVLGRRSVRALVEAGHDVTGLARSDEKAALLRDAGASPARVDLFDAQAIRDVVAGHEVVVNLATHIPSPSKYVLPGAWSENDRIRTEGSTILVDAALAADAARYVQESIAFAYPDRGGELIDEDVDLDLSISNLRSVAAAEEQAARFAASGATGVVLRFGQFYGHDAAHTITQLNAARRGISSFLGPRGAYLAAIHLDDAASAVVASLDARSGTYNVVDDVPMTRTEMDAVVAQALGRSKLRRPPNGVTKLGGKKAGLLTRSQRVSNGRFKAMTGWSPAYPSAREGIRQVVTRLG
jgi:nucleoside-diphosphate-sugar epimerase